MLSQAQIDRVVQMALDEDAPWGDITSEAFLPADATATATLSAREPGVFSGGDVFAAAFRLTNVATATTLHVDDGARFEAGSVLATVTGPARALLRAERIGLNFCQRMSGIATLTRAFVDAVAGTATHIADTRKTTPGLRALERHAVRSGGGRNHRFSLSDAVMAKDNHLAVLTAAGVSVTDAIAQARGRLSHTTTIEVEVDRLDQIEPVLAGGVDVIMLDNFSLDELRQGVAIVADRAIVEASGNVTLDTVRAIAETGVDVISSGALTHSVRALDLGLDVVIEGA
ncbi:carboxylating nicotinate-nucleotide diphosphorylase [Paramicrobacterium sp. CJ85]|uniref:carboxylating nicotinate-nucleotide diphosphorylase n=1 Tax=Paramicrobacterium sp. CJ85 TaxID=3445355 RepID=UPI003F636804